MSKKLNRTFVKLVFLLAVLVTVSAPVTAKCAARTIKIHGRVTGNDFGRSNIIVDVKPKPDWSPPLVAIFVDEEGYFDGSVGFSTYKYSLLWEVCSRKPKRVTVTLCRAGNALDQLVLRIKKDFKVVDDWNYELRKDIVLDAGSANSDTGEQPPNQATLLCASL